METPIVLISSTGADKMGMTRFVGTDELPDVELYQVSVSYPMNVQVAVKGNGLNNEDVANILSNLAEQLKAEEQNGNTH